MTRGPAALPLLVLGLLLASGPGHVVADPSLDALFIDLAERQDLFPSGVIEARESVWTTDSEGGAAALDMARLLTRTPVGGARARQLAAKFEEELLRDLGDADQTLWVLNKSSVGSKLTEIPLEPGDTLTTQRPSRREGMRVHGFQDGIGALYDQMAGTLHLRRCDADSVFAFRARDLDPTLADFPLLMRMKTSGRLLSVSTDRDGAMIVSVRGDGLSKYRFEQVGPIRLLAWLWVSEDGANPDGQSFFGHYGRIDEEGGVAPMARVDIRRADEPGGVRVRALTAIRWERRPLGKEEIEIRVPRGTEIVREDAPRTVH